MSEILKRIEEKHNWPHQNYCRHCNEKHHANPCDVVKLARALDALLRGCEYDPDHPYDNSGPPVSALIEGRRVLREVGGEK